MSGKRDATASDSPSPPIADGHPEGWVELAKKLGATIRESHLPEGADSHVMMAEYMISCARSSQDTNDQIDLLTYSLTEISRAIRCINVTTKPKETRDAG